MRKVITLTLNPCVDEITGVDRVEANCKLRMHSPRYEPGGGGVNVSRVVHRLGGETLAVFPAGGPIGSRLQSLLDRENIDQHAIEIEGDTRLNTNVFEHDSDNQFRFIMPGAELKKDDVARCCDALVQATGEGCCVVMSGSLPPGAAADTYAHVADRLHDQGVRVILDASGEPLRHGVERGVFLIKPNLRELSELVGQRFESDEDIAQAAVGLIEQHNVEAVLVSLGPSGVLLVSRKGRQRIAAPTVTIRSRIGAGDSLVGALALSLSRDEPLGEAVRFGVAAGAAAVTTPGTELCRREDTERLYEHTFEHRPASTNHA